MQAVNLYFGLAGMETHDYGPFQIRDKVPLKKGLEAAGVRLVLMEPNRARKTPQFVADSVGAKLVVLAGLVGGVPEAKSCFELMEFNLRALLKGLQP